MYHGLVDMAAMPCCRLLSGSKSKVRVLRNEPGSEAGVQRLRVLNRNLPRNMCSVLRTMLARTVRRSEYHPLGNIHGG